MTNADFADLLNRVASAAETFDKVHDYTLTKVGRIPSQNAVQIDSTVSDVRLAFQLFAPDTVGVAIGNQSGEVTTAMQTHSLTSLGAAQIVELLESHLPSGKQASR